MKTTKKTNMEYSLVQSVTQQCMWVATTATGLTFDNVRLKSIYPLDFSNMKLTLFGLSPDLPEGLTIDIPLPDAFATVRATGTSGSNRYELTANPDGSTFTLSCKDGIFTFAPQETN